MKPHRPPRLMTGGPGSDRLTGSAADEILVGGPGRDLLSGGAGRDQFVMRSLLEAGDIIGDFQPGIDVLVLDELLRSLGIAGSQALSGGWLVCSTHGSDALIGIDVDGARGPLAARPLLLLRGVGCTALLARPESLKL